MTLEPLHSAQSREVSDDEIVGPSHLEPPERKAALRVPGFLFKDAQAKPLTYRHSESMIFFFFFLSFKTPNLW